MRKNIFEVLCVGIPFCVFKIIMGQTLGQVGYLFIALGFIDLAINLINLTTLAISNKRVFKHCLFSYLVGIVLKFLPKLVHLGPKDMGVAIDTLISFAIVAIFIGKGWLKELNSLQSMAWDWAVILNVLYAGMSRVLESSSRFKLKEVQQ